MSSNTYTLKIDIDDSKIRELEKRLMAVMGGKTAGLSGLSGAAVKYTALANVKQMRELLDSSIDVVGVGGISSGRDVFEMILCGAQGELFRVSMLLLV